MKVQWMLPAMLPLLMPPQATAAPAPVWSVDPSVPGADTPVAGVSAFDVATTVEGRQTIPFPFEKLLTRLEAAAGCSGRPACTRAILLPLGRSLQRVAASPDFFAHPRVVAAFVADGRGSLLLRDRLYLGYQDKTGVIEAISYNETLGRFEFQIVRDYAAGKTPRVSYARRAVCVSCHQNHGPIFSRQVWLETNANPRIAAKLLEHASTFHGVAARGSLDVANAIDDSTDRANRLALVQKLWWQGCGEGVVGNECRRGAAIAAMQFSLTNGRAYDASTDFQREVVDKLQSTARSQWPAGIAIPDADIVNRDPLAVPMGSDASTMANVPARFDPLVPRAPVEIVEAQGRVLADELVRGIASFASASQREELDRVLRQGAQRIRDIDVPCVIEAVGDRVGFDCAASSAVIPAAARAQPNPRSEIDPRLSRGNDELKRSRVHFTGTLERDSGALDSFELGGATVRHLRIRSIERRSDAAHRSVSLSVHDQTSTARLPDGNSISSIVLNWQPRQATGVATLRIRDDFDAAAGLVAAATGPIRATVISDFIDRIRGASPAALVQPHAIIAKHEDRPVAPPAVIFEPDCGNCHHTGEITPPNFLTGDAGRVAAALDSCAARIYVRLAMRDIPPAQRDKTPMPPEPVLLPGQQPPVHNARESAAFAVMRRAIEERLQTQYGRVPTPAELLKNGYETLRPCLPVSG